MIVVDSNVIAYCWVKGRLTALAQSVRVKDPEWHVPILWRSEMHSILTGYLRDGSLSGPQIGRIMEAAEGALAGSEHLVPSASVFEVAGKALLSAYDLRVCRVGIGARRSASYCGQGRAQGVSRPGVDDGSVPHSAGERFRGCPMTSGSGFRSLASGG